MERQKELEIVKKFQEGDRRAFGELYDEYLPKVYRFVYYKTMHQETAEDLTSQIFYKALAGLGDFDISTGDASFRAWLFRIARNKVIDHYRTKKPTADIEEVWDLAGDDDLFRDVLKTEDARKVQKLLAALSRDDREVVVLRIWEELTFAEVGERMEKSEAAVKMSFYRAIKKLRSRV